jgi:hypothetical protein
VRNAFPGVQALAAPHSNHGIDLAAPQPLSMPLDLLIRAFPLKKECDRLDSGLFQALAYAPAHALKPALGYEKRRLGALHKGEIAPQLVQNAVSLYVSRRGDDHTRGTSGRGISGKSILWKILF